MQGMSVVRYALPPVLEDKEIQAQNRAKTEEQQRLKKEEKKKKAKKAKKAEASAKRCREAEKAGLPKPESSETLVSEVEGGEDSRWLNELLDEEEDEEVPRGSQIPGGAEVRQSIVHEYKE